MLNKDIFERMTSLLKKAPCTSLCKGLSSCDYFFLFRKTVTSVHIEIQYTGLTFMSDFEILSIYTLVSL